MYNYIQKIFTKICTGYVHVKEHLLYRICYGVVFPFICFQSKLGTVHAAQRQLQAKSARRANFFLEVGQIEEGLQDM